MTATVSAGGLSGALAFFGAMHWGNIGSFLAGLSTVIIAVAALIRSPGALRDWRARQAAEADAAKARPWLTRSRRSRSA